MENKLPSFMTIHGLKVRLDMDFCMEYLKKNTSEPWSWTIEAYDSLRSIATIIFVFVCMFKDVELTFVMFGTIIVYFCGFYISQSLFAMSVLMVIYVPPYKLYAVLQKILVPYIALIVVAFSTKSFMVLAVFIIARVVCFVISYIVNLIIVHYNMKRFGIYMGDVEVTAYKTHLCYCDDRLEVDNWIRNYSAYLNEIKVSEGED